MLIQSIFYHNPDYYPPMINGAFVLAQHGIKQQILCRDYQPEVMPEGQVDYPPETHVMRLPVARGGSLIAYLIFIWNVLRKSDPAIDIVIGYDMHGFLPARILAWMRHRPLVYHCHDYLNNAGADTLAKRLIKAFERMFAWTADLVIVPDAELARFMVLELKLPHAPLVVANAPLTTFTSDCAKGSSPLRAHGRNFTRIVFRQGSIGPGHGIEMTLHSIPLWADKDWGFVIMGPGSEDYKAALRALANRLGVSDRFVLLPPVPYAEVPCFTNGADLGHAIYKPMTFEHQFSTTGSNKMMEYMAVGLPILSSNTAGNRALLQDYEIGLTADADSPESIAQAINTILGDDELARQMGARSRQAFENEYNYAHQYAPVIARLRELTGLLVPIASEREVGHFK